MNIRNSLGILIGLLVLALVASSVWASPRDPRIDRQALRLTAQDPIGTDSSNDAETTGGGNANNACSSSARSANKSCNDGVKADYWLAVGKCQNVADTADRADCFGEADEARSEDAEECGDFHEARLEICDTLGEDPYDPQIDPADFVEGIDNPLLPYIVGYNWTYEGETEEGLEVIVVEVLEETREILGVECTVVRDTVWVGGEAVEDTFDWYAQDTQGNVWYFGELSYEIEDGVIVSLEGSWESGVDGAHPGIVMFANPIPGETYRQEFLLGEAEDMAQVVSNDASVSIDFGDFDGVTQIREFLPLEPDVTEFKYYVPGIGLVLEDNPEEEVAIELVEFSM